MKRSPRLFRKVRVLTITAAAGVLLAGAGALSAGQAGTGSKAPEAGSIEAVAERLAAGQAREKAELNAHLATAAEDAHGHLAQVLQELASVLPVEATVSSRPVSAIDVDGWNHRLALATSALEAVEEGTSEQTLAREALIGAAELLESAAAGYDQLLSAPADGREVITATVAQRRDAAVRLWQAGAAQLDTLTVGSGGGHVHVFLAPNGDPEAVPQEFQEPESQE
ncbi:hypothetical protein ACFUTU_09305 [Arthrobacter sp. NPDC057388]|uniref:hypothetical protein n=1 Tax=Arthrobacter sp. NPDC057388 TaxID=3346116 RepID=UPI00363507AB